MTFLGMGPLEVMIILVVAFIVLGPQRMMDAASSWARPRARCGA